MKNDSAFTLMIFAITCLMCSAVWWVVGDTGGRNGVYSIMAERGFGEWAIDQSDGKVRFRMFTDAEVISKYLSGSSIRPSPYEYQYKAIK